MEGRQGERSVKAQFSCSIAPDRYLGTRGRGHGRTVTASHDRTDQIYSCIAVCRPDGKFAANRQKLTRWQGAKGREKSRRNVRREHALHTPDGLEGH
jgi:hypothetical protein